MAKRPLEEYKDDPTPDRMDEYGREVLGPLDGERRGLRARYQRRQKDMGRNWSGTEFPGHRGGLIAHSQDELFSWAGGGDEMILLIHLKTSKRLQMKISVFNTMCGRGESRY